MKRKSINRTIYILGLMCMGVCWYSSGSFAAPKVPDSEVFYTYFGGNGDDKILATAVDASGYLYIGGSTTSTNLPVSLTAFSRWYNGGTTDAFILKLNPDGSTIEYCTYLGGSGEDHLYDLVVDDDGSVFATGWTTSGNFPKTPDAYDATLSSREAFLVKVDAIGNTLLYSTYFGSSDYDYGFALDLDTDRNVYLCGFTHGTIPSMTYTAQPSNAGLGDGFVAKFDMTNTSLAYGTLLGGQWWDAAQSVHVVNGTAILAGNSQSPDFPVTLDAFDQTNPVPAVNGGEDGFFTLLNPDATAFTYSTFLGQSGTMISSTLDVEYQNRYYVVGNTQDEAWTTGDAAQPAYGGGDADGAFYIIAQDLSGLTYGTYLGGDGKDTCGKVSLDSEGNAYVSGYTNSTDFPNGTSPFGGYDAYALALNTMGQIAWARRYGGSGDDGSDADYRTVRSVLSPLEDRMYVLGTSSSTDLPVSGSALQGTFGGGTYDGFIVGLSLLDAAATPPMPTTATPTPSVSPTPTATPFWHVDYFGPGGYATPNPCFPRRGEKVFFNIYKNYINGSFRIVIMTIQGKVVRTLQNEVYWDGRNRQGEYCEGGVYLYQIHLEGKRLNGKVIILK